MHEHAYEWVWEGGLPALDLVNTVRFRELEPVETLPDSDAVLIWLQEARLLETGTAPHSHDLVRDAHALRTAMEAILDIRPLNAHAVEVINFWADHAPRPHLELRHDHAVVVSPSSASQARNPSEALGQIAASLIELMSSGRLEDVKKCDYDRCGLRFVDRTPRRQRRWCSMKRCGNRAKARRHALRSRE